MARTISVNVFIIDEFSAFNKKMKDKISGLVDADFSVSVFFNKALVDPEDVEVTIGEYGVTGSYWVQWKPDRVGFWEVEVKVISTGQYWYETYDAVNDNDPGSLANKNFDVRGTIVWNTQRDELVADAWMNKNGQLIATPHNCYWDFYDSDNNLLFTISQPTPFANGIYRAKKSHPNFGVEENYFYIVRINDGVIEHKSALGFITII